VHVDVLVHVLVDVIDHEHVQVHEHVNGHAW